MQTKMADFTVVRFDQKAADYIWRQLRDGGTFSQELLRRATPIREVWSFMPNPPPKAIVHFEGGDIEGHLSRRMALVQWIAEYLSRDSNHCIVFENVASEPGYPWLRDSGVPYFSFQSEVYHVLTGPDHKVDAINKLISVAATDRLVGALTRCPLEPDRMVSADTIADLARDAEAVIVGAWDGAGELVWQIRRQSITQEGKIGRPRRSPNRRMR